MLCDEYAKFVLAISLYLSKDACHLDLSIYLISNPKKFPSDLSKSDCIKNDFILIIKRIFK